MLVRSTALADTVTASPFTFDFTSPITGGVLSTTTGSLTRAPVFPSPGGLDIASDATTRISYRPSATVRVSQLKLFSMSLSFSKIHGALGPARKYRLY